MTVSIPEHLLKIGDIISRDGNDEHEIIEICDFGDLIHVKCVKEPPVYLGTDKPWTLLGETEWNLSCRYEFVRSGKGVSLD